jgi:hypothetical protein
MGRQKAKKERPATRIERVERNKAKNRSAEVGMKHARRAHHNIFFPRVKVDTQDGFVWKSSRKENYTPLKIWIRDNKNLFGSQVTRKLSRIMSR